jgi:hypothetical protein
MNKTLLISCMTVSVSMWIVAGASAQDFSTPDQRQRDLLYGNAPALSQDDEPISQTAEQEGHYVLGVSDQPLSRPNEDDATPQRSQPTQVATNPSEGVLIAVPRTQRVLTEEPRPTTRANQRSAQVNDSQSLDKTIEEHKWTLPF